MKLKTLLYLFLMAGFTLQSRAQVDPFSEIEYSNRNSVQELDFEDIPPLEEELEVIDSLEGIANEDITPFHPPRPEKRASRPKQWEPIPFEAVLKEGSILKHLETGKFYKVRQKIIVKAREKFNGSLISFIHDSKGKLKYETRTHNLVDISEDLDLLSDLPAHEEFPPRSQLLTTNKYLELQNGLYYSLENIGATYLSELFETEGTTATAYRWDYKLFFRWETPVYFGLIAGIQNGTFDPGDGAILNWQSYYFGPGVKYRFKESTNWAWEAHTSFQKSLGFTAESEDISMRFASNLWTLEGIGVLKTNWGDVTFHLGYKKQRMQLKKTNLFVTQDSDRDSLTYLSFSLGYQWNFQL